MSRTKIAALTLAAIALFATFALVVGCSSSSSSSAAASGSASAASASASAASASAASASASAASASAAAQGTLEDYFKTHQSEWDNAVASIKESGGDVMGVDLTVSGNKISQIMTFKQTYNESQVEQIKANLEAQIDGLKTQVSQQVKSMEQAAGISGITWFFDYRNGDGTSIVALEVGAE